MFFTFLVSCDIKREIPSNAGNTRVIPPVRTDALSEIEEEGFYFLKFPLKNEKGEKYNKLYFAALVENISINKKSYFLFLFSVRHTFPAVGTHFGRPVSWNEYEYGPRNRLRILPISFNEDKVLITGMGFESFKDIAEDIDDDYNSKKIESFILNKDILFYPVTEMTAEIYNSSPLLYWTKEETLKGLLPLGITSFNDLSSLRKLISDEASYLSDTDKWN